MIRLSVVLLIMVVTNGFGIPQSTVLHPVDRLADWSPHNVYFPGITNHQNYYHSAPDKSFPFRPRPMYFPQSPSQTHSPAYWPTPSWSSGPAWASSPSPSPPSASSPSPLPASTPKVNSIVPEYDFCKLTAEPPEPDSQCCGVEASSSNNIVGGNVTKLEQYPWLVLIEYLDKPKNRLRRLCGGFLISGKYIVTAAHCLVGAIKSFGTPINIILGEYNATNDGPDCLPHRPGVKRECTDGAIKVPIERTVVHPKHYHDSNVSYNDIGLIKMSRIVEYTNFIRPICLPASDVTVSAPPDLRLYTAGWGAIKQRLVFEMGQKKFAGEYDNVKRHVDLPYRSIESCREKLGSFVGQGHLCAGGERGMDSCRGDSGGPLMHENDGIFEVVGVVSAGSGSNPCGTEGFPAIYTKVYDFVDWIKQNTKA